MAKTPPPKVTKPDDPVEAMVAAHEAEHGRPFAKVTDLEIERLAGKGLREPRKIGVREVRELCGSVLRHIINQRHASG
jgi:hypothetical protein